MESTPLVLNAFASFSFRPLAWWGHIDGWTILWNVPASLSGSTFTPRALPWYAAVPSCRWPDARRWKHRCTRQRPGQGNHPAIGPVAMQAWDGSSGRSHSKGDGPNGNLTQRQPRTSGRFLGGNALSGFWFLLPEQKEPPAGSVPTQAEGLERRKRRRTDIPPPASPTGRANHSISRVATTSTPVPSKS